MVNLMNFIDQTILPKENYETFSIENDINKANKIIHKIQSESTQYGECFLSFYPLAKNIRFVSSHFFQAIKSYKKPILSQNERPGEGFFWKTNTGGDNWFPWMWTRSYQKRDSNRESWSNIFKSIEDIIQIPKEDLAGQEINDFILYLTCLNHTFRLQDSFEKYLIEKYSSSIWPDNAPVCALQIRRGEIVPRDGDIKQAWSARPLFHVKDYMIGLEKVCDTLNTKNVFVSTDSVEVIEYLTNNYKNYNFIYNNFDRNLFITYTGSDPHLEIDLQKQPQLIQHYTESCLIDLLYLSKCKGFVGGMSFSEYGVCGWLLQMVKQKKIYPYFNVEGELDFNNPKNGLLLV